MNIPFLISVVFNLVLLITIRFIYKSPKRNEKRTQKLILELKEKINELEHEIHRQSLVINDYKERLHFNRKDNEINGASFNIVDNSENINDVLSDKQKFEAEKEAFKQKTLKLWGQSLAIYKEKERIDSLRKYIESKHTHITQSISYAQRIQQSLLPTEEFLRQILPDFFLIYRPRDIVSGDFYWTRQVGLKTILVAADCTGHGVPGAFMSLLGISSLNEIVISDKELNAAAILEKMRNKIKTSFKDDFGDIQINDGMDMVVCIFDHSTNNLEFSGANNGIFIARTDKTLYELKGTRNPVSYYRKEIPFENHIIKLEANESVFMYSDGYFDQISEKTKERIKRSQFKELIEKCIQKDIPLKEYHNELVSFLEEWQGKEKQIDDILVFGVTLYTDTKNDEFF